MIGELLLLTENGGENKMAVINIYVNTKRLETLKPVPGENDSQKIGFLIDAYKDQRQGEEQ